MDLFVSLMFLAVCTALGAVILSPTLSRFKSPALTVVAAWLVGHIIAAQVIYALAILLTSTGMSDVLWKSTSVFFLGSCAVVGACLVSTRNPVARRVMRKIAGCCGGIHLLVCGIVVTFAALFYLPHLSEESGLIKKSAVYWDFNIHFPIIQSFVRGDNFPAQNPSMAGVPLTYHFFFDLLVSIYSSLGTDLVTAMNFVSIMSLAAMLLGLFGLSVEIFSSYLVGAVALPLVVTTASLRFLMDARNIWRESLFGWLEKVLRQHPYHFAFVEGNVAGYNGNMFNVFYFLAERQLVVATTFVLTMSGILLYRAQLSRIEVLSVGVIAGLFVNWHLFATISVLVMLASLCCWGPGRKQSLGILMCTGVLVGWEGLHTYAVLHSGIFLPRTLEYPKVNLAFSTMMPRTGEAYPLSFAHFVFYWVFAYGIKIVLLPLAIRSLWRRSPDATRVLLCWIVPTFILVNLVQLSPLSVYDNHKWLRPMNVAIDLLIASYVVVVGRLGSRLRSALTMGVLMVLLTSSGLVENIPYAKLSLSRPSGIFYANERTPLIETIESSTPRGAVFHGVNVLEVHMAGRKTFLPNKADESGATNIIDSFGINEHPRKEIVSQIYAAASLDELCRHAQEQRIDFLEVSAKSPVVSVYPLGAEWPRITGNNRHNHEISFLDLARVCSDKASLKTRPRHEKPVGVVLPLKDQRFTRDPSTGKRVPH
jgi:hypothetical protein